MANQLPGYTAGTTQQPREPMLTRTGMIEIPGGAVLDGTNGNDGKNTSRTYDIRAGWPIAKITATGLWVPCKRTRANGAGSAGTALTVDNSAAFLAGDSIVIGSNSAVAISSINHATNVITIASAKTWADNDDVYVSNGSQTCRGYLGDFARLRNDENSAAANKSATLIIGGVLKQSQLFGDTDAIWSDPESLKYLKLLLLSDDQSQSVEASVDDLTVVDTVTAPVLVFNGATGVNEIRVPTNLADALSVEDTAGDLIVVTTTTGSQLITITPDLKLAADLQMLGTTGTHDLVLADNVADALSIKITGGADLIVLKTTDAAEQVIIPNNFGVGTDATDRVTIKGIYMTPANVAVTIPSFAAETTDSVDVDVAAALSMAPAVGDVVIAIPQEALPTDCLLAGAIVTAADTIRVSFDAKEGGGVTGAAKNFKFLVIDLT